MSRQAREKSSTGIYAVTLRGNGNIFATKQMRELFTTSAEYYIADGLLGIRFSDNKVDMLICESTKGISVDMKSLTTSFARAYNKYNNVDGNVFADRFRSVPIEDEESQKKCLAYMKGGIIAAAFVIGLRDKRTPETKRKLSVKIKSHQTNSDKMNTTSKNNQNADVEIKKSKMPSWLL